MRVPKVGHELTFSAVSDLDSVAAIRLRFRGATTVKMVMLSYGAHKSSPERLSSSLAPRTHNLPM